MTSSPLPERSDVLDATPFLLGTVICLIGYFSDQCEDSEQEKGLGLSKTVVIIIVIALAYREVTLDVSFWIHVIMSLT